LQQSIIGGDSGEKHVSKPLACCPIVCIERAAYG
jgi:hypothetical protein